MDINSSPDVGVIKALALSNLPLTGKAYEFGCGTARNLSAVAKKFPSRSVGFELEPSMIDSAKERIKQRHVKATIVYQDVLKKTLRSNTVSFAIVGTAIYWPKSVVVKFLNSLWAALLVNGVLHIEFSTPKDSVLKSDFVRYTCLPYPDEGYQNSFGHYCGYDCMMDHPGVIGASFWTKDEVHQVLGSLGGIRYVHQHLRAWNQKTTEIDPDTGKKTQEKTFRSFYVVTIQKVQ